jgi:hypothetical protein
VTNETPGPFGKNAGQQRNTKQKRASESHYLTASMTDLQRKNRTIRIEILASVSKLDNVVVTVDTGATFSAISRRCVRSAGLEDRIRDTKMTYKTSSGEVRKAEGKIKVPLKLGSLKLHVSMVVMLEECSYNVLLANDVMPAHSRLTSCKAPMRSSSISREMRQVSPFWKILLKVMNFQMRILFAQ